ncbi:hypothetical protein DQ353_12560 [Arthrobacter sp. AQ5-05]|uniref:hypothetical protein n=1 Tax=Arthrobacter sp. AQ5-05 TaxID=2184581 RepID=UPI000DCD3A7D|nr:hypothetical protein [Arthrobacter sp. AQ5-05]RAX48945.1 hypothetical protein DQ353_12560 [Arthrobacter sp. AQ5-05]
MNDFTANLTAITDRYGDDAPALFEAAFRRREYRLRHGGKHCPICERDLTVSAFSRDSQARDGLRGYCRECDREKYLARQAAKAAKAAA